jgi:hypothetical protein
MVYSADQDADSVADSHAIASTAGGVHRAQKAGQPKSHQGIHQPAELLVHDQPREWGGDFNREGCYSGSSLLAPKGSV